MASPQAGTRASTYQSIEVEAVGEDEFVSKQLWRGDVGRGRQLRTAYGGQLLGQALMSACRTVNDPDLLLLSAHCYFVSPVSFDSPVQYHVTRTKDGRVFSIRGVQVLQAGKVVSHCLASFKRSESNPPSLSHSPQGIPPGTYPPDDPRQDREKLLFNHKISMESLPLDSYYCFRNHDQERVLAGEPLEPRTMSWMKCYGDFPESCTQNEHRVALAFLSDFSMTYPIRLKYPKFEFSITASLDHSMWFHGPVQCDQMWFLHTVECIQAKEGTSLNSSHMYSEDGTHVATCQQQALFRPKSNL